MITPSYYKKLIHKKLMNLCSINIAYVFLCFPPGPNLIVDFYVRLKSDDLRSKVINLKLLSKDVKFCVWRVRIIFSEINF